MCINSNVKSFSNKISDMSLRYIYNPKDINAIFDLLPTKSIAISDINDGNIKNIKGFPENTYGYGCLISIKTTKYRYQGLQIYIPHIYDTEQEVNKNIYFRTFGDNNGGSDSKIDPSKIKWRCIYPDKFVKCIQ